MTKVEFTNEEFDLLLRTLSNSIMEHQCSLVSCAKRQELYNKLKSLRRTQEWVGDT